MKSINHFITISYLVYGSTYSNQTWNRRQILPARHIACPQRLKYIHGIQLIFTIFN